MRLKGEGAREGGRAPNHAAVGRRQLGEKSWGPPCSSGKGSARPRQSPGAQVSIGRDLHLTRSVPAEYTHHSQFIGWSGVQAKCSDKSRGQLLEAPNYTPHGKSSEQPSARPPHPSFSSYGWQGSSQSPWKTVDSYGNRGLG